MVKHSSARCQFKSKFAYKSQAVPAIIVALIPPRWTYISATTQFWLSIQLASIYRQNTWPKRLEGSTTVKIICHPYSREFLGADKKQPGSWPLPGKESIQDVSEAASIPIFL